MIEVVQNVIAALATSLLFCLSTAKMVGIMQQSGYKNTAFWGWLKRKDNLYFNRLSVLALCLALAAAVVSLCFSFLGTAWAVLISALPFFVLVTLYWTADETYALKVKSKRTGRWLRLWFIYYFFTSTVAYILIAVLGFLAEWNGSELYALVAYVPYAVMPLLLPSLLALANLTTGIFENAHNKKYVKGAGQVLAEAKITRVAVVGSYGKTSVKNILKTLLAEEYSVVETPASFNTPMGIAKTVLSDDFKDKEIFIAEMGARKTGDIAELCTLVRPDYALFTGVCNQHILTFGSAEAILREKSQILHSGAKKVVCGNSLIGKVGGENALFITPAQNVRLGARKTAFTLLLGEEKIEVETALLGRAAVENITLAATLCYEMGMRAEKIKEGISKLQPIEHRLQLLENNGVYILDDGYNCNIVGAENALEVLGFFEGRTCVVTPGIVEGGILEESLNNQLGGLLAKGGFDKVILVGETLVGAVKDGYKAAGGDDEKLASAKSLDEAQGLFQEWLQTGDAVLFLNDLPDVY